MFLRSWFDIKFLCVEQFLRICCSFWSISWLIQNFFSNEMADYPPVERVNILLILGECHRNYRQAAALYWARYPERRHPNDVAIRNIFLRAEQGHLVRVRLNHNYDENDVRVLVILAMVHINPHISRYQIEGETGIPRRTFEKPTLSPVSYHINASHHTKWYEDAYAVLPMGTTND